MTNRASLLFALAILAAAQVASCQKKASFKPALAGDFFPLRPDSTWTYRVVDTSQNTTEILTDRALRKDHVDTPSAVGEVVSEYSGLDGTRKSATLYLIEGGYLTRNSSLGDPAWILSEERRFLPQRLKPDLTWSNTLFPFNHLLEAFHVTQSHRTFLEADDVVVPAGHFFRCIRIETEAVYEGGLSPGVVGRRLTYLDWYALNVGLVKTLVLNGGPYAHEIARLELLSFVESQIKGSTHLSKAALMPSMSVPQRVRPSSSPPLG
jgi:hypothetical protein